MGLPIYTGILGRMWYYTFLFICGLVFIILIAPILVIVPLSFNAEPYFTFTEGMLRLDPDSFSTRWYRDVLGFGGGTGDNRGYEWADAAKNSVFIATLSTVISTFMGTIAAIGLSRPRIPYRRFIMALLISPLIVPIIITAVGMFFYYSSVGLAYSYLGIILSHAAIGMPFVVITVTATLLGFDQTLMYSSASLGAKPVRTYFKIVFPLIIPGVLSGALFAFITSFDEVVLVYFLANAEQRTIPMKMWSGLNQQISPSILAVASLLLLLTFLVMATIEILRRKNEKIRGISAL